MTHRLAPATPLRATGGILILKFVFRMAISLGWQGGRHSFGKIFPGTGVPPRGGAVSHERGTPVLFCRMPRNSTNRVADFVGAGLALCRTQCQDADTVANT
jgi:hypothetical protein